MKKLLLIFVLIPLFNLIGIAQTYDLTLQLSGFHNPIWSTFFTDASTGYAVCADGLIVKTTNGGTTWTQQSSGVTTHLCSVFFVNANIGWAVGVDCTVLKTTNGGNTWVKQSSGQFNDHFNSVYFIDANTGYLVTTRGSILKTTDGGFSWINQRSQYNPFLFSVYFTDASTGYAVGGTGTNGSTPSVMKILKTTNGGTLWTEITNGVTDGVLHSVYFANSSTGYAVGIKNNGHSAILKTTDGGTTWTEKTISTANCLRSVFFTDTNTGFCTGDGGSIFRTTDGGGTWTNISESTMRQNNEGLYSSYFINSHLGWIACSNGFIIKYTSPSSSTSIQFPTVSTTSVSSKTTTTATTGGNISADGGAAVTARGVCWSTSLNPTIANSKTSDGTGTGSFTSSITGLTANTTYYVRAYATNSVGTAYGPSINFTTLQAAAVLPTLTTTTTTSIAQTSATSGGNITSDGGAAVTARGVCWSTSPNPTIANSKTSDGSGIGSYTSLITGLTANTTYYVRAYATNSIGTGYGSQVSFTTTVASGTVTDCDGNVYHTVTIGTQTWMVENLKTTKYNDCTAIPNVPDSTAWAALTTPAYSWYNNDASTNKETYGALYNWYTVNTGKLCPTGWHIPTDAEWATLINYLGGETIAGGKLKEIGITHWLSPNTAADNTSGFTALPGGCRSGYGKTYDIGYCGFWWSSSESYAAGVWYWSVLYDLSCVDRYYADKSCGLSVRCVRD